MPRHVSTPELRAYQWQRKKEEEQRATRERQELRELYNLTAIQGVLRQHGLKTATKQRSQVWGCPSYYDGYWVNYSETGPYIDFHHTPLDVFLDIVRELREMGIKLDTIKEPEWRTYGEHTTFIKAGVIFLQRII